MLDGLKKQLATFNERKPSSVPDEAGKMLNIVADERLPYDKLYDVLSVFRESGFDTLIFVTVSKKGEAR